MDRQFIPGEGNSVRHLRSPREIGLMRKAGLLVWQAHQAATELIYPGITTGEISAAMAKIFESAGAEPLFLGYPGPTPFPAVSCISVNEEVVHGIPGDRQLQEGDIVSIDTGCPIDGWCGDAAITHAVGRVAPEVEALLDTTRGVLDLAIKLLGEKNRWSEVAKEMQVFVEDAGFSVVEDFVGHAIGREMHEQPQVPNYYSEQWARRGDFDLRPGTVLVIEPMVNMGTRKVKVMPDQWTQSTQDGKWSAHFEHTVALTVDGPRVLTCAPQPDED